MSEVSGTRVNHDGADARRAPGVGCTVDQRLQQVRNGLGVEGRGGRPRHVGAVAGFGYDGQSLLTA
jgi:hypothetical protein